MGTRFAACKYLKVYIYILVRVLLFINSSLSVSLKLTSLHDYYQRLLHGSQPVPSGLDMANTLKFFSQMLLCKNFDTYTCSR